jgi:hypothetical protein
MFVSTIVFSNHTKLESFFFQTVYQGDHLKQWAEVSLLIRSNLLTTTFQRSKMLQRWRQVIDRYPTFNATAFHDEGVFLDLIENMPTGKPQLVKERTYFGFRCLAIGACDAGLHDIHLLCLHVRHIYGFGCLGRNCVHNDRFDFWYMSQN